MFRSMLRALVFAIISTGAAQASTVGPATKSVTLSKSGGWVQFRFDIGLHGGVWLDAEADPSAGPLSALSFQLSLDEKSTVQVTDAFRWGDVFDVFADGVSLGRTSTPAVLAETNQFDYFSDFDAAIADEANGSRWSFGAFHLEPGDYTLTGYVVQMPETRGRGALRVVDYTGELTDPTTSPQQEAVSQVPVPGAMSLMLVAWLITAIGHRHLETQRRN